MQASLDSVPTFRPIDRWAHPRNLYTFPHQQFQTGLRNYTNCRHFTGSNNESVAVLHEANHLEMQSKESMQEFYWNDTANDGLVQSTKWRHRATSGQEHDSLVGLTVTSADSRAMRRRCWSDIDDPAEYHNSLYAISLENESDFHNVKVPTGNANKGYIKKGKSKTRLAMIPSRKLGGRNKESSVQSESSICFSEMQGCEQSPRRIRNGNDSSTRLLELISPTAIPYHSVMPVSLASLTTSSNRRPSLKGAPKIPSISPTRSICCFQQTTFGKRPLPMGAGPRCVSNETPSNAANSSKCASVVTPLTQLNFDCSSGNADASKKSPSVHLAHENSYSASLNEMPTIVGAKISSRLFNKTGNLPQENLSDACQNSRSAVTLAVIGKSSADKDVHKESPLSPSATCKQEAPSSKEPVSSEKWPVDSARAFNYNFTGCGEGCDAIVESGTNNSLGSSSNGVLSEDIDAGSAKSFMSVSTTGRTSTISACTTQSKASSLINEFNRKRNKNKIVALEELKYLVERSFVPKFARSGGSTSGGSERNSKHLSKSKGCLV